MAFTGERGMGKSSTMINFLNSLDAERSRSVLSPIHGKIQFIKLDVIDPSLFRGDESIFEIVLAQMFRKFKTILEQQVFQNKDEERRKLIFSFQKVYDTFRWTKKDHNDVYSEESIDNLIHLAKGSNLKASFNDLIQIFLSFTGGKGNNKLVVTIDDFDLKTNGIKEMLEDIRQLLINSNIVILIAYKEDQLRDLLQRNFSKEIENVSSRNFRLERETIKIQVDKYLEKLLPNSHQIELLSSNHKEIKSYLKKVIELSPDDEQNENETNYRQADKRLLAVSYLKQNQFIMLEDFSTSFLYKPNYVA
ncbi:KAP family NTPase [Sphingobacterium sp. KU25419]|nr:KAP family NTPase [Sphingobacterium sp. KU25419]